MKTLFKSIFSFVGLVAIAGVVLPMIPQEFDASIVHTATPEQLAMIAERLEHGFDVVEAHYSPAGEGPHEQKYLVSALVRSGGFTDYAVWTTDDDLSAQYPQLKKVSQSHFTKGPMPLSTRYKITYTDYENGKNLARFMSKQQSEYKKQEKL